MLQALEQERAQLYEVLAFELLVIHRDVVRPEDAPALEDRVEVLNQSRLGLEVDSEDLVS